MPLTRGHYPNFRREYVLDGQQAGLFRPNITRLEITTDVATALTTQIMTGVAMHLETGEVVNKLGFLVGATAAGTPVNAWVALYDTSAIPALIGQSVTSAAAAIPADVLYEQALAAAYTVPKTGAYIAALMVQATVVPSLQCKVLPRASSAGAVVVGMAPLAATSGAALTTTAPATWATPTTVANIAYATVR